MKLVFQRLVLGASLVMYHCFGLQLGGKAPKDSIPRVRCKHNCAQQSTTAMPWTLAVQQVYDLAREQKRISDKFTTHSYQTMYGTFLAPLQNSDYAPKVLEIGLGCDMDYGPGASASFWQSLLPKAELWEAEYDEACVNKSRLNGQLDGIHTVTGDQGDEGVVQGWIAASGGKFDVIIDDGGHRNTQIKSSFDVLWPTVKAGGLYFLEDLQLGRHPGWDDTAGDMVISDIVQSWTEQLLIAKASDSNAASTVNPAALKWPLPDALEFIFCQREACVLGKSPDGSKSGAQQAQPQTLASSTIDMCQFPKNERPTLCQTEAPWTKAELTQELKDFAKVYAKRPWKQNGGGGGVNHHFALWYAVRKLKPRHIIESGVWAGMGTWIMRQAAPHAWIHSFDPDDSHLQYRDRISGLTQYFVGDNFTDIAQMQWDKLIPGDQRARTLVMLDDHQSVMTRIPQLLANGFEHVWYDDNCKYNDRCYSFSWLCNPLQHGTTEVLVESLGKESRNISLQEHNHNLDYLLQRLDTYFDFPAIFDGCNPDDDALFKTPESLIPLGLPALEVETYRYAHCHPVYVKLHSIGQQLEPSVFEQTPSLFKEVFKQSTDPNHDTQQEPALFKQMSPEQRVLFFQTLNNSLSPQDVPSAYWATYLKQDTPVPKPLEQTAYAHCYWHGSFHWKLGLAVKSFLVTQDMKRMKVIVWLDARTPNMTKELHDLQKYGVEVRLFDYAKEVQGTPLDGVFKDNLIEFTGHKAWPELRTASDLTRYVLLYKFGGLWFDSDVMFLRDMSALMPYEFAYPWSKRRPSGAPENHTLNCALMRLLPGSSANLDLITRVSHERIPFGLWGLSALRDDTKHPDLRVVDVEIFDPMWKHSSYFTVPEAAQLLQSEPTADWEQHRFEWFFDNDANVVEMGLSLIGSSHSLAYHWHNKYDLDAPAGSAISLYETFFDCALAGRCSHLVESLRQPLASSERGKI